MKHSIKPLLRCKWCMQCNRIASASRIATFQSQRRPLCFKGFWIWCRNPHTWPKARGEFNANHQYVGLWNFQRRFPCRNQEGKSIAMPSPLLLPLTAFFLPLTGLSLCCVEDSCEASLRRSLAAMAVPGPPGTIWQHQPLESLLRRVSITFGVLCPFDHTNHDGLLHPQAMILSMIHRCSARGCTARTPDCVPWRR